MKNEVKHKPIHINGIQCETIFPFTSHQFGLIYQITDSTVPNTKDIKTNVSKTLYLTFFYWNSIHNLIIIPNKKLIYQLTL